MIKSDIRAQCRSVRTSRSETPKASSTKEALNHDVADSGIAQESTGPRTAWQYFGFSTSRRGRFKSKLCASVPILLTSVGIQRRQPTALASILKRSRFSASSGILKRRPAGLPLAGRLVLFRTYWTVSWHAAGVEFNERDWSIGRGWKNRLLAEHARVYMIDIFRKYVGTRSTGRRLERYGTSIEHTVARNESCGPRNRRSCARRETRSSSCMSWDRRCDDHGGQPKMSPCLPAWRSF